MVIHSHRQPFYFQSCIGKNTMKNLKIQLIAIFSILLLASMVSCSPQESLPADSNAPAATTAPIPLPLQTIQPGDSARSLKVGDLDRSYLLHIPPGMDASLPVPVVFAFHGYSGDATNIQTYGFNDTADKKGFVLVAPFGTGATGGLSWNAGACCGAASAGNVDEAAFIRAILTDLGTLVKVDPKRVYATGFSNGAFLSYRLACEMSDTFSAVAPVSGNLIYSPCQPQQPVSVIHIHGLADTVVPFSGAGDSMGSSGELSVAAWVQLDGCNPTPQVETQMNIITHTTYTGCQSASGVELYTIDKLGHSWPSIYVLPASDLIWDFFAAHPRQ
jgi:polyhydroxybutyrate depolymerase